MPTTPMGCLIVTLRTPSMVAGMWSPYALIASAANLEVSCGFSQKASPFDERSGVGLLASGVGQGLSVLQGLA